MFLSSSLFPRNLAPHYTPWTTKDILAMEKLYCYFEGSFCYEFCLKRDVVGLEESSLVLSFSKMFLVDLKMSTELLKCLFLFISFFQIICLILHILRWKYFAEFFRAFFTVKFPFNTSINFCTFWLFALLLV